MTSRTGQPTSNAIRRRGFTLLELILVLAILAMAAAAVAPSLVHFARHRRMLDAAATILALTQHARNAAANDGRPWRLRLDSAESVCWLESQRDGAFAIFGRKVAFPSDVLIGWDDPESDLRGYVQFESDGSHDAAAVMVTDADGRSVRIESVTLSEPFRVVESESGREVNT